MIEPRLVTLNTADHGQVTFECPLWCIGHGAEVGRGIYRDDITHNSVRVKAAVDTYSGGMQNLMSAQITWAPFLEIVPRVGFEFDLAGTFEAEEATHLAGVLRTAATRLEGVAAQAILMRGDAV